MTTRKKILGGFLILFIIGFILGICGLVSTRMLTELSDKQFETQKASSGVSEVLDAHYTWRQAITEAVLNGSEFTGSLDSNTCALGKWRNSPEAQSINDAAVLTLLSSLDEPHKYIHNEAKIVVDLIKAGDIEEARSELTERILPRTAEVIKILTDMDSRYEVLLNEIGAEVLVLGRNIMFLIIALLITAAILCVFLAAIITRSIMKPIKDMAVTAEKIAAGDLNAQVKYNIKDEIGVLADSFRNLITNTKKQVAVAECLANGDLTAKIEQRGENDIMNISLKKVIDNLNAMFGDIRVSSEQVSAGSVQISQGAQELANGSSAQAASIEEFSSALSEIQIKTNKTAENSAKAQEANNRTAEKLDNSIRSMHDMLEAMKGIDESSKKITGVIKVIDDIAFKTNILALNAAVEAARAGVHGKGFAVVADEVRNLAAKSAEAAKETSELIEGSAARVQTGNSIVAKTNADLEAAVENARESTGLMQQVVSDSTGQVKAITEINRRIEQISNVIQANSANSEQSAAAAEQMSAQSVMLNDIVSRFKLNKPV